MAPIGSKSGVENGSVLDEETRQKLVNHVGILSKNVYASDTLLGNFFDRHILTRTEYADIKKLRSSEARITKVIHSLLTKGHVAFKEFCDVLRTNGHSFFASSLLETEISSKSFFDPLVWKELPEIDKKLQKCEKESLEEKFNTKMMELLMTKSACEHKPIERRVSETRLKQLNMEYKLKFKAVDDQYQKNVGALTEQLDFLRRKAMEQEESEDLRRQRMDTTIKKLTSNLQVANRFNIANDNTIRRTQECLELYEELLAFMHSQLPHVARNTPLIRDELDFEDVKVASTLKSQVNDMKDRLCRQQIRLQQLEKRSELFDDLKRFLVGCFRHSASDEGADDQQDNAALKTDIEELMTELHNQVDRLEKDNKIIASERDNERQNVKILKSQISKHEFLCTVSVGVNNVPSMENKAMNTTASKSSTSGGVRSSTVDKQIQTDFDQPIPQSMIDEKHKSKSDTYGDVEPDFQLVPFVKSLSKPPTLSKRTSLIISDNNNKIKLPPLSPDITAQTKGYLPFSFQIERKTKQDYLDAKKKDNRKKLTFNSYQFL